MGQLYFIRLSTPYGQIYPPPPPIRIPAKSKNIMTLTLTFHYRPFYSVNKTFEIAFFSSNMPANMEWDGGISTCQLDQI